MDDHPLIARTKAHSEKMQRELPDPNPSGRCLCGCGLPTEIAPQTSTEKGWVRGKHKRFARGHSGGRPAQPVGTRRVRVDGYAEVHLPDHPEAATNNGWVLEHRLVMERTLGHPLPPGTEVHHNKKATSRSDNRPECLELTPSKSAHQKIHGASRKTSWAPKYPHLVGCRNCGSSQRVHAARGLCRLCWDRERLQKKRPTYKWSRDYPCCTSCGRTDRKHKAHGLCATCYAREWCP